MMWRNLSVGRDEQMDDFYAVGSGSDIPVFTLDAQRQPVASGIYTMHAGCIAPQKGWLVPTSDAGGSTQVTVRIGA